MNLALKIFTLILTVLIGVFPSFFAVTNGKNESFYNRLNTAGWVVIVSIVILTVISIVVEIRNDKENENTKISINDIKNALKKSKLYYDSTDKVIVSNTNTSNVNTNTSGINFSGGANSFFGGNQVYGNTIGSKVILDSYQLEEDIRSAIKELKISDTEVYLYAISNTEGHNRLSYIKKVLERCSLAVIEKGYIDLSDKEGIKLAKDTSSGKLMVIVGNDAIRITH